MAFAQLSYWSLGVASQKVRAFPSFLPHPNPLPPRAEGRVRGGAILKLLRSYAFGQLSIFDWLFLNLWALRPSARMVGALYFKI